MDFPPFSEAVLHSMLTNLIILFCPLQVLGSLSGRSSNYGRHMKEGGGLVLRTDLAWFLMEGCAFFSMLSCLLLSTRNEIPRYILGSMFLVHYFNRTFVYTLRMRSGFRPMYASIACLGGLFCTLNGYVNGRYLFKFGELGEGVSMESWRFWTGCLLWAGGAALNVWGDETLRRLRPVNSEGYKVPHKGLFNYVSCPNFLGEIIEWFGWSMAAGFSKPSLAFSLWTFSFLSSRAYEHHQWYLRSFKNYHQLKRRILVPFLW